MLLQRQISQDGLATERRPVGEEMKKHQMVWVVYPSGAAQREQGFSSRCQTRDTYCAAGMIQFHLRAKKAFAALLFSLL